MKFRKEENDGINIVYFSRCWFVFIWMNLMSDGLQKVAGQKMRDVLEK